MIGAQILLRRHYYQACIRVRAGAGEQVATSAFAFPMQAIAFNVCGPFYIN